MIRIATLIAALLLLAGPTYAEQDPPDFIKALFPPDLIMRHGRDIDLSKEQRNAITKAVSNTQARTLELQWDLQDAARSLTELMSAPQIDEKSALAAAKRVMDLEGQVKRSHLALLIQIKNQLEPEQQAALTRLREE